MKYMGSKSRHALEIRDIIWKEIKNFENNSYVEPFVGGANMICKIPNVSFERYGNDINVHLITMFQEIQKGWIPPDSVSEEDYKELQKMSKHFLYSTGSALIGFVGIGCSYSGKWFGGYARGNANNGQPRNYCLESKKNLLKQDISGVVFTHGDYKDMYIPDSSIIYCDPPYAGTTKYKDNFNHEQFWCWCDEQIDKGNKVYVSEYNAPEGWKCIWEKKVNNSLTKETGSKQGVEKLFTKI